MELEPSPMRISHVQPHLANRLNEARIDFTQEEIEETYKAIVKAIEYKKSEIKQVEVV
jgi:hypothetical protein